MHFTSADFLFIILQGPELLKKVGGLHKFMGWNRALLADSGGSRIVPLVQCADVTEQGVKFRSPYGGISH